MPTPTGAGTLLEQIMAMLFDVSVVEPVVPLKVSQYHYECWGEFRGAFRGVYGARFCSDRRRGGLPPRRRGGIALKG